MRYLAAALMVAALTWGQADAAQKHSGLRMGVHYEAYIPHDRKSIIFTAPDGSKLVTDPIPRDEAWYKVATKSGTVFLAYHMSADGQPLAPDTSNIVADTDAFGNGFLRNQNGALVIAFDPSSTTSGFTFDGSGNLNVNVQAFTGTITTSNAPPNNAYGTNTLLISQADFHTNEATCTAVTAAASYDGTAPSNTAHYCWIVKASAGTLFRVTWDSTSNMNTLVAATIVTCYDNATTTSGAIVFQGSMGAYQIVDFAPYGRPFVRGLTCIANHAFGSLQVDSMEWLLK